MDVRNMDVFVVPLCPKMPYWLIHAKRTYLYSEMILLLSWKKTLDCIFEGCGTAHGDRSVEDSS